MRVGEILLQHNWVDWESIALAIDDHKRTRMRIVSYLVWKGAVDFDDASRALGEQLGVAAALRKHLENRDRTLTTEIPAHYARRRVVLPIGRLGNGALIVVARDPSPGLQAELGRVVQGPFVLAVAPGKYLERMVATSYPRGASGELDVPIEIDDAEELGDGDLLSDEPEHDFDIDVEIPPPKPVSTSKPLPVEIKPMSVPRRAPTEPVRDPLETAIAALADIDEAEWLLDTVMGYATHRWQSSLLLKLEERRAVGLRAHGGKLKPSAIPTFVIPLSEPSSVSLARDAKQVVDSTPEETSKAQTALVEALGLTGTPVAAPFVQGDNVRYVLLVGDPVAGKDPEDSAIDLGMLGEAMQDALARLE